MTTEHKPHLMADDFETIRKVFRFEADPLIVGNAALERIEEQKEAADRVLTVADQLADWVRVTVSVAGVFSNNRGAQAQAQGLANLLTRYAATRDSYPASIPCATCDGVGAQAGAHTERVEPCPSCDGTGRPT